MIGSLHRRDTLDRTSGKPLTAGRSGLSQGSTVFYKDGHIFGATLDEADDFVLRSLKLKGL